MESANLRLLGEFQVTAVDGTELSLRGKKARGLLAVAALAAGRPVNRGRLAGMLWGDMPDDRALHNLRQAIAEIRRLMGAHALRNSSHGLWVDETSLVVDVCEFVRLAGATTLADRLRAVRLYRGDLLRDLRLNETGFEDWLTPERARLRRLACDTAATLAQEAWAAGDDDMCLTAARSHLSIDPACENAHRRVMHVHVRRGERSEAARQYEACRDALASHLDSKPDATTAALFRSLRDQPAPAAPRAEPPLPPVPDKPSVAVLPFKNLSGDPEQAYFSDGVTEDIIIDLSRFDSLFVIARHSSFQYREQEDALTVGRQLGVHYVVRGSVRRRGDRIRIGVRLVDVGTGANVWAERYDGASADLFALQDEVTTTIVATLAGQVEGARLATMKASSPPSLALYDCLLRGKDHHHRYTAADNALSQRWLAEALDIDPTCARACAWMACAIVQSRAFVPDPSVVDRAFAYVAMARESGERDSECQRVLASYYLLKKQFDQAEHHQARAMALNPNDDRIVCQMGELLVSLGRPDEGIGWIELAMRLNPHHADGHWFEYGRGLYSAGRCSEAAAALRRIAAPRFTHLAFLAASYANTADDRAGEVAAELLTVRPALTAVAVAGSQAYLEPSDAARLAGDLRRAGLA